MSERHQGLFNSPRSPQAASVDIGDQCRQLARVHWYALHIRLTVGWPVHQGSDEDADTLNRISIAIRVLRRRHFPVRREPYEQWMDRGSVWQL